MIVGDNIQYTVVHCTVVISNSNIEITHVQCDIFYESLAETGNRLVYIHTKYTSVYR